MPAKRDDAAMRKMIEEMNRVYLDFAYFLSHYVYIQDAQLMAEVKWSSWPCHQELAQAIKDNKLIIVLKARQLGISWMLSAYALWLIMFRYGARVTIFSKREEEAAALLERARYIFRHLPNNWPITPIKEDNATRFTIDKLDSGIYAYPATGDSGRSESATLVICDEWAFHPNPETQFAAIKPIIDAGGGRFIGVSTGNGAGNFFHSTWMKALAGENNFKPLFFPWRARPDRDDAWYEKQQKEYGMALLRQEYPSNPEEAFIQTGSPYFEDEYLELRAFRKEPVAFHSLPDELKVSPHIRVYGFPQPGRKYCLGVDVAEGESLSRDPDESCLTVLDAEANEEVLFLCGRWDITRFSNMVHAVARYYAPSVTGVERNGNGIAVVKRLEELGTPGLYRDEPLLLRQGQQPSRGRHGWSTNISTRPVMMQELRDHLMHGYHRVATPKFLDQARVFQDYGGGNCGAPPGYHDDTIFARAIALQMRKHLSQTGVTGPRSIRKGPSLWVA